MKKYLTRISSITAFIIQCVLFLPDFILYLSWKNEKNFYRIIPFLKEKSYINPEDFLNSATIMVINWHQISLILFLLIFIISIIDVIKNKSIANIIFNISLVTQTSHIKKTVHHEKSIDKATKVTKLSSH